MIKKLMTSALLILCGTAVDATAHHSRATFFDMDQTIELAGKITRVQWRNPHVRYWIQADPEFGGEIWELETTPPGLLERQGISRDILAAGTRVRVAGPPSRVAEHAMEVSHVLLPDGREVLLHTGRPPRWTDNTVERGAKSFDAAAVREAEAAAHGIFRVWARPGLAADDRPPFWLDSYPVTATARAAAANWDPVTDIETGCMPRGMPALMASLLPVEFIDDGDRLRLRAEENDQVRIIYLGESAAPETSSPLGYSVGHWEDGDLIVLTSHVSSMQLGNRGIPLSENVTLLERFSMRSDGRRLDYALTITDPETFTQPVHLTSYWAWQPGESVQPYDCVETPGSWTSRERRLLEGRAD